MDFIRLSYHKSSGTGCPCPAPIPPRICRGAALRFASRLRYNITFAPATHLIRMRRFFPHLPIDYPGKRAHDRVEFTPVSKERLEAFLRFRVTVHCSSLERRREYALEQRILCQSSQMPTCIAIVKTRVCPLLLRSVFSILHCCSGHIIFVTLTKK